MNTSFRDKCDTVLYEYKAESSSESTLELLEREPWLDLKLMLERLLELLDRLEPMLELLDCLEHRLMESRALSKLTKGVPKELSTLRVSVLSGYLSAMTSVRFSVSAPGITSAVSIAVSIAASVAVSIIIMISFTTMRCLVSAFVALAALVALVIFRFRVIWADSISTGDYGPSCGISSYSCHHYCLASSRHHCF